VFDLKAQRAEVSRMMHDLDLRIRCRNIEVAGLLHTELHTEADLAGDETATGHLIAARDSLFFFLKATE
jgi:hypothetical protein